MFPTPTFTPQQTKMAQQIIDHIHGNQAYFASLAFFNFFPWSWKFAIYHFLSSLPIPKLPTVLLILLITFGPFVALLFFLLIRHNRPIDTQKEA